MSAIRRPEALLFDLFHTLVDVNTAPGLSSARLLGIDPLVWNRVVFHESAHHALGTVPDPYESFRRMVHKADPNIPEERIRRAAEARPARFREALLRIRPDILAALGRLKKMGLRFALLSNAGFDEIEAWDESPLAPLFDQVLFSCREGLMKPDPAFYRLAARRLEAAPAACFFVGDGGSDEHDGARAAGMRTVLILGLLEESLPEIAAARRRDTDFVVQTMGELADVIAALPV